MDKTLTIKNHFGGSVRATHPIFSLKFLAENIASFVETIVLFAEIVLIFAFGFSVICLATKFADNAAYVLVNCLSDDVFALFRTESTIASNLIALNVTIYTFLLTKKYFDWVKFNLHPKD